MKDLGDLMGQLILQIILAIITTIIVGLLAYIRRSWLRSIWRRIRRPKFSSFKKVQREIKRLHKEIKPPAAARRPFQPPVVLGIGWSDLVGGVIVGAWLASPKYLRLKDGFFQISGGNPLPLSTKADEKIQESSRILVVDDESQSGETIRSTLEKLRKHYPNVDIRVAVIVVRQASWDLLGQDFWRQNFCCYGPIEDSLEIKWPWETKRRQGD